MGWLNRIFGGNKEDAAPVVASGMGTLGDSGAETADAPTEIPQERVGLNGEYDQSGLAKRVAQAFDQDPELVDIETLWVAQLGTKVVLKGTAPDQAKLDKMVDIAGAIDGAASVDTSQVTIGA